MTSYKIIVSRYNENLDWLNKLTKENIVIYNKGISFIENSINRINIGREIETFLHHITENYYNLPEYLILVQGNPFDHMFNTINSDNLQEHINLLVDSKIEDIQPLFCNKHYENHGVYPSIKSAQYFSLFFSTEVPTQSIFSPGCQYIIPKKNILNRPINFYSKIHSMALNSSIIDVNESTYGNHPFNINSIDPWCLERLLMFIFCKNIQTSNFFL